MAMTKVAAIGCIAREGLALPATQLIEDGWATAPVRVFSAMHEQHRNLVPTFRGRGPLQLKGLGDGLAGNRELQGEAPRMQGGRWAWCVRLLWASLHGVDMREQGGDGRGDERGIQEGLQGARLLGIDRVQPVDRLIQPDAELHLPADAVEVGDLPRPDRGGRFVRKKP